MDFKKRAALAIAATVFGFAAATGAGAQTAAALGWESAAQTLEARFDIAETRAESMPMLANREDASLLRAVLNLDAIWAVGSQDFPTIDRRCTAVRHISNRYSFIGTGLQPGQTANRDQQIASGRNWARYHDELSLSLAATILCLTRSAEALDKFMRALPADQRTAFRRRAAVSGRGHLAQMVVYVIGMQTEAIGYTSPTNRELLINTLAKAEPVLAPLFSTEDRGRVRTAVDQQLPNVPAADRNTLTAIRRGFELSECSGLCAMVAD